MKVYLVGAGPGDPGLLTRKGAALLSVADVVVYDRLVDPAVLALAPPAALLVDVGKTPGDAARAWLAEGAQAAEGAPPSHGAPLAAGSSRQEEINRLLVHHGRTARTVVRLKGGDPFLFGRGGEEADALQAAGVDWEVVPGVTSAFAAPAAAGIPVTHRGLSTSVTVVTGHVGDPSVLGGVDWESLGRAGGTLVVLMGMANRDEISRRLVRAGRPGSTPVAVVEWGTTPAQRVERSTLDQLAQVKLGSPSVVVIGAVAGLALGGPVESARGLAGASVVVTRPREYDELSPSLVAAGARVVSVPAIEIAEPFDRGAALARAAQNLTQYRWVVFTSANAVRRLVPHARDARSFAGVGLAAVGRATANALAERHLVADLVPERADAEALVDDFPMPDVSGERVLFPAAEQAGRSVPEGLRAKGWDVDVIVAYRTVPAAPPSPAVAGAIGGAWAIVFSSPSAVESYMAMRVGGGRLTIPEVIVCGGPSTERAARDAGLEVRVVPPSPMAGAIVEALTAERRRAAP